MADPGADRNPEYEQQVQAQVSEFSKTTWYHSIELPDSTVVPGLIGIDALRTRLNSFPLPQDLAGKRLLDIGAATGWNSFEAERRGARVTAVDCVEYEEFSIAHRRLGSSVDYRTLDMDELTPETIGVFDYVLFLGVLYHLRHPLLGLEKVCSLTTDAAFVESFVTDAPSLSLEEALAQPSRLDFYENDELGGQFDNWYGPNASCVTAMCRSAGFASVKLEYIRDRKAGVTCRRRHPPGEGSEAAPVVLSAQNNRGNEPIFHCGKDEYVNLYFGSPSKGLTKQNVYVEIDGYGVPLLSVFGRGGDDWQASMKAPPWLALGAHGIQVRTAGSRLSEPFEFEVRGPEAERDEAPAAAGPPAQEQTDPAPLIVRIENSRDRSTTFRGYKNEFLCCYFQVSAAALGKEDLVLEVAGQPLPISALIRGGGAEWQANCKLPQDLTPGPHTVRLRTRRSPYGDAVSIQFATG